MIREHIKLLGLKVKDRVTKKRGIVTSVNFDLYGCIQALVTVNNEDTKWYDVSRLKILSNEAVMRVPNFEKGYIAKGLKGGQEKPTNRRSI